MRKIKSIILLFVFSSLFLISCSARPDSTPQTIKNSGSIQVSDTDGEVSEYVRSSDEEFFASLDFELSAGRVDWEIQNPKGKVAFRGYAVYQDGKTFRQLIYPADFLKGTMSNKEEIKNEPDFNYLQFKDPVQKGTYKLVLIPKNAAGKYTVEWHSRLPRK